MRLDMLLHGVITGNGVKRLKRATKNSMSEVDIRNLAKAKLEIFLKDVIGDTIQIFRHPESNVIREDDMLLSLHSFDMRNRWRCVTFCSECQNVRRSVSAPP